MQASFSYKVFSHLNFNFKSSFSFSKKWKIRLVMRLVLVKTAFENIIEQSTELVWIYRTEISAKNAVFWKNWKLCKFESRQVFSLYNPVRAVCLKAYGAAWSLSCAKQSFMVKLRYNCFHWHNNVIPRTCCVVAEQIESCVLCNARKKKQCTYHKENMFAPVFLVWMTACCATALCKP